MTTFDYRSSSNVLYSDGSGVAIYSTIVQLGRTSEKIEGEGANFILMTFDYCSSSNLLYGEGSGVASVPKFNW